MCMSLDTGSSTEGMSALTSFLTRRVATTNGSLTAGRTARITFTTSEETTTFGLAAVTVTNGTLSNFAGSGTSYTATFTPRAKFKGTASIAVAAGKFADRAGNANLAGSLAPGLVIDT